MEKEKVLDTIENIHKINKKLNLDEGIQSFTERNHYYTNEEAKVFEAEKDLDPAKPSVVELFCGLGGTTMGFEMAGFQTVLGIDIHGPSVETFRHAHPTAISVLGDITKLVKIDEDNSQSLIVKKVKEKLGGKSPDVLVAGIPCQGFSLSNSKRHHLDARNYLFLYFVEMAKALNPKVVMIENVSGLRSLKKGEFEDGIIKALSQLGYQTHAKILSANEYGVPQKRRRIVFLGTKEGFIEFPKPIFKENEFRTVKDAIADLPRLNSGESKSEYLSEPLNEYQKLMRASVKELKNHEAPSHPQEVIDKIDSTLPGKPLYPKFKQRIRLSWDQPSPTQVSGGIRPQFQFGHPGDARGLTIRERCRIQSIPDKVEVYGGLVQGRVQTGNAVPPLLAKAVANEINKYLKDGKNFIKVQQQMLD